MPRPAIKRRKQNSFSKSSPRRYDGPANTNAHREYLQKKLANVKVGSKPENSDDSDGIVTSQSGGRTRRAIEIYGSGGVAKGDKPGAFPTRSQRTRLLRGDTEEILSQRSRSTSRAASVTSTSPAQALSVPPKEKTGANKATSTKRQPPTKSNSTMNGTSSNTQTETSVLGVIKPRKRQNSILDTMGIGYDSLGPDSSAVHSDEEERFLPDEISTPAPVSTKAGVRSDAAKTTSSLKRKRGEAVASKQLPVRSSSPLSSLHSQQISPRDAQSELPRPSRSQQRKLSTTQRASIVFNDIMAPPESSDSEDSSDEHEQLPVQSPKMKKQDPVVPSTRQLQNLMPTKREQPISAFQPQDEFDIREDSTSSSEEVEKEQEEHSTFSPVKTRRGQRNGLGQLKNKTKGKENTKKVTAKGGKENGKIKPKSTRNTSYTPSPVRLRTPLPLSSSKARGSQAKSPSKQDTIMRDKTTNTPLATRSSRSTKKRYGGSRRKEAGKENQAILLSDVASGSDDNPVDEKKLQAARRQVKGPEIEAWKKKWANIDDFELEFEEAPVSTRSSSPTGMSR